MKQSDDPKQFISLGLNLAVGMGVFSFIGIKLDESYGDGILWTMVGVVFGLSYCGYEIWKLNRKLNSDEKKSLDH